jgi:hypothetical protein
MRRMWASGHRAGSTTRRSTFTTAVAVAVVSVGSLVGISVAGSALELNLGNSASGQVFLGI